MAPRLDRTTPDFLSVVRDARTSKYAATLDAFPGGETSATQPGGGGNFHLIGNTEDVDTSELVLAEASTMPSATPVVRSRPIDLRPPSTETIDELIDGLPFHVQPQRKKWDRSERRAAERLDDARSARAPRERSSRPPSSRHSRRGPWVAAFGASLLAALLVAAFAVVRLSKSDDVATWYQAPITTTVALTVSVQPPQAPAVAPGSMFNSEAPKIVIGAPPAAPAANVSPRVRNGDKHAPSEQRARADVARSAHADELESDVGNATLPKGSSPQPLPPPSQESVRDLLTGH